MTPPTTVGEARTQGMIDIHVKTVEQATIVEIVGEIDAQTAPEVREGITAQVHPGVKMLLDLTGVEFMSSAGLRVLLGTYRQVKSSQGQVVLVGLSTELQDVMSMTGFLRFFSVYESVDLGLAALE
jgi:anti-sigma B factor antagonist